MLRTLLLAVKIAIISLAIAAPLSAAATQVVHAQPVLAIAPSLRIDIKDLPQVSTGQSRIKAILTIVFSIVGATALLMITIGGFRYVTSQGDPQAAARAKGTITFALVGLLVAITSVILVTFVIGQL